MRAIMIVVFVSVVVAACGGGDKSSSNACCVTQAQCEALNVDELTPCGPGQACRDGACVASECSTSMDCPTENPICVNNLCVATCSSDAECADTGRPFCEAGACIGCRSPVDCSPSAPICDQEDRTCRGCRADDECASGVCIEADSVCAQTDQLIHVKMFGVDTGTCEASAPCRTLQYALTQVTPTRDVIRVTGGTISADNQTISINTSVVIDGTGTSIMEPFNLGAPMFQITSGTVTIEGFRITGQTSTATMPTISISGGTLRMTRATTNTALISGTNATIELTDMEVENATSFDATMVSCSTGTLTVIDVEFPKSVVESTNCLLTVQRSRFDGNNDRSIRATGGKVTIENNLIIESYELSDSMSVTSSAPGSVVRFNTFVNTSGVDSDGVALFCDGTQDVSNNIFAYRSMHPMGGSGGTPCPTRYSLFDSVAVEEHRAGEGNRVSEFALIFANASAKDFHLAPTSQAKEGAQPNLVDVDLEGMPRPQPAATNPDMGCYEAP